MEGEILVNGQSVGKSVTSVSAYVQQEDIFVGTLTVKKICLKKKVLQEITLDQKTFTFLWIVFDILGSRTSDDPSSTSAAFIIQCEAESCQG